jgi:DNA-binding MarR family transcriptional regulator
MTVQQQAGFLLSRAANAWQRAVRQALNGLGLTHAQVATLQAVAELSKELRAVSQQAIAGRSGIDPMTVSQLVRALVARGLLSRGDHPSDARAFALHLTTRGKATLDRAVPLIAEVDRRFFDAVDAGSIVEAMEALLPTAEAQSEG